MKPASLRMWSIEVLADVILLDQLTKWLMRQAANPVFQFDVAGLHLQLALTRNAAFAFSIPAPTMVIGAVVGVILCVVTCLYVQALRAGKATAWGLALILGGALSNIIDRFWQGAVLDWINVGLGQWTWSSFNIADVAIVAGVALTLYLGRKPAVVISA